MSEESSKKQGCLGFIFKLLVPDEKSKKYSAGSPLDDPLPFRRKDYLLSRAEKSFFLVLRQTVGDEYLLFSKIRLADLVWMPKGTDRRQRHQNTINQKHVDFVLCDHENVRPLLAIELDDASHQGAKRVKRDEFLDKALNAAGLPLLRVPAKAGYSVAQLREQIRSAIR